MTNLGCTISPFFALVGFGSFPFPPFAEGTAAVTILGSVLHYIKYKFNKLKQHAITIISSPMV